MRSELPVLTVSGTEGMLCDLAVGARQSAGALFTFSPQTVSKNSCTRKEVWGCSAIGKDELTTVPPHTDSLVVSIKTKAGPVTERHDTTAALYRTHRRCTNYSPPSLSRAPGGRGERGDRERQKGGQEIIFRKISDVKKEEEERQRAKNEVPLTIPVDHPVRKLFQKFKQQKELRNQEASAQHDLGKNQQLLHTHLQHTQLQHAHTAITQNTLHAVQNGTASTGCCSSVVTISQITPIQNSLSFSKPSDPVKQNNRDIMDLKPSGDQTPGTTRVKVSNAARAKPAGTARGWMKLKNNMAPPGSPPEGGGKEGRNNVIKAVSMERLSPEVKVQIEGVIEVSSSRKNSLRKTDSWDSGLTHSDQRLDHVEEAQSPGPGGEALGPDFYPGHEPSFQTVLQEARTELRGEIQALSGRMSVLEEQVGQILRLLSGKSDPPVRTSTPKTYRDKLKAQDIFTVSTPGSPDSDREDGSV
ncbi:hypothetical protein NFI96_010085 [Prochilodus magdalenae]|nr:hypothetical protein NFI96_010085 [Prochilodus magdalenae]